MEVCGKALYAGIGIEVLDGDARITQNLHSELVGIALLVYDAHDAGVDNHLGTDDAGLVAAVQRGSLDGDTHLGSLDDGVLFGVDGIAQFMPGAGRDVEFAAQAFALFHAA